MRAASLTAACAVAVALLAPAPAQAALKHTDNIVFQQLADLTRADNLKHHPGKPFGSISASSQDLSKVEQGVDWKIVKTEDADGDEKTKGPLASFAGLEPIFDNGKTVNEWLGQGLADLRSKFLKKLEDGIGLSSRRAEQSKRAASSPAAKKSQSGSTFSPILPPSFPLAVRHPYLNVWAPAGQLPSATPPNKVGNGGYLAGQDPSFWTSSYGAPGGYRLGWHGFIRVDGTTYQWLGDAFGNTVREGENAKQVAASYTATKTTFNFTAGGVAFGVTFLTPIWPEDFVRQSLPLSYMHVEIDSKSASGKSVQIFTDIDERWVTAHEDQWPEYSYQPTFEDIKGVSRYWISRDKPQTYTEYRQRAEWGNVTFAARDRPSLTSRNNNNVVTQLEFINKGKLSIDHGRAAGDQNSFAYAVDFDAQQGTYDALFAIGHFRSPYVNYIRKNANGKGSYQEDRYGLWNKNFTFDEAVTFFLNDYENALQHSTKFDAQVEKDSKDVVGGGDVGDHYAAITALTLRQSLATIEWTISKTAKGKWNETDVLVFLKEISSNGDMSTVDVMFPQFPLLTYLNPEILKLIMLPIFEYTESGLYPNKWCVHDLGVYPNAFGHNDGNDEPMQVEESGNMILMTLHWAQLVGKQTAIPFLKQHYKIMSQWAEFLIEDSLIPAAQLSTDDFAGVLANQTNLAIKGIEGIAAMGKIADLIGQSSNASYYHNVSTKYIKQWQKYALSKDRSHTKLSYQEDKSWGTLYNLFGDRLLNLELVPRTIYDIQDNWYPRVVEKWGVPLDSRHNWTKSDWQMFTSAISPQQSTRDLFINKLYNFYASGRTDAPATDLYETTTGDFPKQPFDPQIYFLARPVVGGHFMHLALQKADRANGIDAVNNPYKYGPASNDEVYSVDNYFDDPKTDEKADLIHHEDDSKQEQSGKKTQQGATRPEPARQQATFRMVPRYYN
ncbi:unnamed protein product [Sympodiomycopsis kandeliae]